MEINTIKKIRWKKEQKDLDEDEKANLSDLIERSNDISTNLETLANRVS